MFPSYRDVMVLVSHDIDDQQLVNICKKHSGVMIKKVIFRNVFPGYREVMVLENTHPMLGTCGTLSWQLVEINLRLIVMWRYHDDDDYDDYNE